jgi:hypothetical protein
MKPYLEKNPPQKRAGGVSQGVGPEFKPQYWGKKKDIAIPAARISILDNQDLNFNCRNSVHL